MANPNIVNVVSIYGKTNALAVTTGGDDIVTNSAASNKIYKVNTLIISNVDGVNSADITVEVFKGASGFKIANTVAVPPDASLVVISKDTSIYLEENDKIRCTASAASDLQAVCSWEEID